MQVNHKATGVEPLPVLGIQDCPSPGRENNVLQCSHAIEDFDFATPESWLAFNLEDHPDTDAAAGLDLVVSIVEFPAEPARKRAPDRGLARSGHAYQEKIRRSIHRGILSICHGQKKSRARRPFLRAHKLPGARGLGKAGRDEYQQFRLVIPTGGAAEQVAYDRKVSE